MNTKVERTAIDLSGLAGFDLDAPSPAAGSGAPVRILLTDIEPDPDNARIQFSEGNLRELAENIKERGVKEPVSVRSRGASGKYVLNSGLRRYLASQQAGLTDIPAFIDDETDEFDRFNVNEARENLSPLDRARFIAKKRDEGLSLAEIGNRVSPKRSKGFIQQHLVLFDLAPALRALYDKDVCQNVSALYDLHRLHKKNAGIVEKAIDGITEVTAALLADIAARIGLQTPPGGDGDEGGADAGAGASKANTTPPALPRRQMKIILKRKDGKRYQLVGDFATFTPPSTPGFILVKKGGEDPIEVDVKELTLDSIVVAKEK